MSQERKAGLELLLATRRLIAFALLTTACRSAVTPSVPSGPTPPVIGAACGVERWAVKTLADADASSVNLAPIVTSVASLNTMPARCTGLPSARIVPGEAQVYEVVARVTVVRREDDRDYHIVLADPSGATMVAEVADPACSAAANPTHRELLTQARAAFEQLGGTALVGTTLRIRGVAFYDTAHGQTGMAPNCLELHPVTMVALP